ncbi:MAG TPA: DinB family protein [Gemmatimonadaceae bacterium]
MTGSTIAAIICRELRTLERELNAYPTEAQIWELPAGLPNSAGTLALHAAGNLQHFVGTMLGGTSYVRDRDAEFSRRNVPRADLIEDLRNAERAVRDTLPAMEADRFAETYPLPVANRRVNTGEFMAHLATHLAYHAGQLNYHRRIVTGDASGVGAVSPLELPSAAPIEA